MRFVSLLVAASLVLAPLSACSTRSGATYTPDEAGQTMEVTKATVNQSRPVIIEGLKSDQAAGWGTIIGATVGGATSYGLTGSDTPLGVAVTILAAVGGALVGTFVEEQKNKRPGAEYIVTDENGGTYGVVQTLPSDEKMIPSGSKVLILRNSRGFVRVVPDK